MRGFVVGRSAVRVADRRIYFNESTKRVAGTEQVRIQALNSHRVDVSAAPDLPDLRGATLVSSRGVLVRWINLVTKEQTWS